MPRLSVNRNPKYRRHASGQAAVRLNCKDIYLGRFDSPESRKAYDDVISAWIKDGRQLRAKATEAGLTLFELTQHFWLRAQAAHKPREFGSRGHLDCLKSALHVLVRVYDPHTRAEFGEMPADDFGPLELETVRQAMVKERWSVGFINRQVYRIRKMFRWAAGMKLVLGTTAAALLGYKSIKSTERYAEPDLAPAVAAAKVAG